MKAIFLAMGAGVPALTLAMGIAIAGSHSEEARTRDLNPAQGEAARTRMAAVADAPAVTVPTATAPLSQIENVPERVATARVTDAHGKVVGAVQKVEIQNGRPTKVDIALLGSANLITLDAATLRYDAASNIVATDETVAQLMARAQT